MLYPEMKGMTIDLVKNVTNYRNAYEQLEVVNRAVNMIVDDRAEIPFELEKNTGYYTPVMKILRRTKSRLITKLKSQILFKM